MGVKPFTWMCSRGYKRKEEEELQREQNNKRPKSHPNDQLANGMKTSNSNKLDDEDKRSEWDESNEPEDGFVISQEQAEARRRSYRTPSTILPNLYIGTYAQSLDFKMLRKKNIMYLLCVKEKARCPPRDFKFMHVPLSDYGRTLLEQSFRKAFPFINHAIEQNMGVMVFCSQGVNRAPSIVIAYLMFKNRWTLKKAYEHVRSKRTRASPHEKYFDQLCNYEKTLFGSNSYAEAEKPLSLQEYMRRCIAQQRQDGQNNIKKDHQAEIPSASTPGRLVQLINMDNYNGVISPEESGTDSTPKQEKSSVGPIPKAGGSWRSPHTRPSVPQGMDLEIDIETSTRKRGASGAAGAGFLFEDGLDINGAG